MPLKFYIEPVSDDTSSHCPKSILRWIPHEQTTLDECDFVICMQIPWGCINSSHIQDTLHSYRTSPKKVLVFMISDYNEPFDIPPNVLLFRPGMYKSQQRLNEFLLPYVWVIDELKGEHSFSPLPKMSIRPTIGFCGSITSHPCRVSHINAIKRTPDIKCNFILRTQYWGGKNGDIGVITDFRKNVEGNHFTLCSRGSGNWSARFYQVLYMGRIPAVVNTDLVLPFEDRINWRDIIVLCDNENTLSTSIKHFWNTKDIPTAQAICKDIFEQFLSPAAWCKIIAEEILEPMVKNNSYSNIVI